MSKSTKVAIKTRIAQVRELLLSGHTRSHILELGKENWDLADRQIDEYIQKATLEIEEVNKASAENMMACITSDLWILYRNNFRTNPGLARGILLDIARLRGLDKLELTVNLKREHKDATEEELSKAVANHA